MNDISKTRMSSLRARAEQLLEQAPDESNLKAYRDVHSLAQELAIHQAELELQNEQLMETQEDLQDARDRFAFLYENAPVGYLVLDKAGIVRRTNNTACLILEAEADKILDKPFASLLLPEDSKLFLSRFRAFFRNPARKQLILRTEGKKGKVRFIQIEAQPSSPRMDRVKRAGTEANLMVTVSDITELHAAQKEIEHRNQALVRLNSVLEGLRKVDQLIAHETNPACLIENACNTLTDSMSYFNTWIVLLDPETRKVTATAHSGFEGGQYEEMQSLLNRDMLPACVQAALKSKETQVFSNLLIDCADCPLSSTYEGRCGFACCLCFGQSVFGVMAGSVPREFAQEPGEHQMFRDLATDVAYGLHKLEQNKEIEKTHRQLREREHFLSTLMDAIPVPVFYKDRDGKYLGFNRSFETFFGMLQEEMVGKSVFDISPPELAKIYHEKDTELLRSGGKQTYESQVKNAQGELRDVVFQKSVFKDSNGETAGLIGGVLDITERKRAEQEKLNVEAQIRQAQKLDSIGTLAGGVAHEINNPINGIMNYAQLIKDRLGDEQPNLTEFAGEIIHETKRIALLVRDLLAFARQEQQAHSSCDIRDIVVRTTSLVRAILRQDQITLEERLPDNLPKFQCRRQQIQQVLMNLITNARDALNEKYPDMNDYKVIKIMASKLEKDGQPWVRVTVEDHGTGIPQEHLERVFDPFYTTKECDKGTGLGLSTVSVRTATLLTGIRPTGRLTGAKPID